MDKMELIGSLIHLGWMRYQQACGRRYGPKRTSATHPHLVAWEELDEEARNQDRFIAAVLIFDWVHGNLDKVDMARAIHDVWVVWERAHGNDHPHALPYEVVHAVDPGEHAVQAAEVLPVLESMPTA